MITYIRYWFAERAAYKAVGRAMAYSQSRTWHHGVQMAKNRRADRLIAKMNALGDQL